MIPFLRFAFPVRYATLAERLYECLYEVMIKLHFVFCPNYLINGAP